MAEHTLRGSPQTGACFCIQLKVGTETEEPVHEPPFQAQLLNVQLKQSYNASQVDGIPSGHRLEREAICFSAGDQNEKHLA